MKKVDPRTGVLISFVILVLLVISLYYFTDWFSRVTGYFTGEEEKVKLARCLDEKGAEFYDSVGCEECERQVKEFGRVIQIVNRVDCDKEDCSNIKELPAWYISGEVYYGFKNLTELSEISGCKFK